MDTRYRRLITLLKLVGGTLYGRKRLQKIVYILQVKSAPFKEDFSYHYYGPYSSELQLEIDNMVEKELVVESEPEENSTCYVYKLKDDVFEEDESIVKYGELIEVLKKQKTDILELTSTLYYLKDKGVGDESILKKKLEALKPTLSDKIPDAFALHESIEDIH